MNGSYLLCCLNNVVGEMYSVFMLVIRVVRLRMWRISFGSFRGLGDWLRNVGKSVW